jgi:hypothetical protein
MSGPSLRWTALALACAALPALGGCTRSGGAPGGAPYVLLDDEASELRADFNRAHGSVRLLFVIDPLCATCLRGLDDLDRDLLSRTTDRRLQTFVVHEPVLGVARVAPWTRTTAAHDVPAAAELAHNPYVHHYWNASGAFGQLLSQAVNLKNGERAVYAWDVWLVYGPEATWTQAGPGRPRLLMHQLAALRGSQEFPPLDSRAFAQKVHELLALLPAPSPAAAAR